MLQTFTMMSSTEASSASSASTAGSSGSDPAIAELLRGMHQMQEEHRVVCQRQEETTAGPQGQQHVQEERQRVPIQGIRPGGGSSGCGFKLPGSHRGGQCRGERAA